MTYESDGSSDTDINGSASTVPLTEQQAALLLTARPEGPSLSTGGSPYSTASVTFSMDITPRPFSGSLSSAQQPRATRRISLETMHQGAVPFSIQPGSSRQGGSRSLPAGRPDPQVEKELVPPNSEPPRTSASMYGSEPQSQQDGTRSELNTPSSPQDHEIRHQPMSKEYNQAQRTQARVRAADISSGSQPRPGPWQHENNPEQRSVPKSEWRPVVPKAPEPEEVLEAADVQLIDLMTALRDHTEILDSESLQTVQDEALRIYTLENQGFRIIRPEHDHKVMVDIIMDMWTYIVQQVLALTSRNREIRRWLDMMAQMYRAQTGDLPVQQERSQHEAQPTAPLPTGPAGSNQPSPKRRRSPDRRSGQTPPAAGSSSHGTATGWTTVESEPTPVREPWKPYFRYDVDQPLPRRESPPEKRQAATPECWPQGYNEEDENDPPAEPPVRRARNDYRGPYVRKSNWHTEEDPSTRGGYVAWNDSDSNPRWMAATPHDEANPEEPWNHQPVQTSRSTPRSSPKRQHDLVQPRASFLSRSGAMSTKSGPTSSYQAEEG